MTEEKIKKEKYNLDDINPNIFSFPFLHYPQSK